VRRLRIGTVLIGALAAVGLVYWLNGARVAERAPAPSGIVRGGRLLATQRSEPLSFNRYLSANPTEELLARLTHASLVRLNRATGALEPRLAREWSSTPDGLTWTLKLRENLLFSDGAPFTAADVVFSFEVLYDAKVASPLASSMMVARKPLAVSAPDALTIEIVFPAPYGPGLAMLDSLPILPAHKLRAAFKAGTLRKTWTTSTPPAELAGLGPFMLQEYTPAQRLVLVRNPHFWRTDDEGRSLPFLDEIEIQLVPDLNAEMLRLESGAVDVITDQVRAEDLTALQVRQSQGSLTLNEAGVAINPQMFWLNLNPASALAKSRPWSQVTALRVAISHAVDRRRIVDTVYLGAAEPIFGPITPGHGEWYLPDLPKTDYDPARARTLLTEIGLIDRDGDGLLDDEQGQPARFSLVTLKGHTIRERIAAIVQEQLRAVGLTVDVVPLERSALLTELVGGTYEAALFSVDFDSFDPGGHLDYWPSSGDFHIWHPAQVQPASEWEARIDDLMQRQSATTDRAERLRLFGDVQRVFAANLPVIYFAAPKVVVAMSARVGGAMPSVLPPTVLWNAELLWLVPEPAGAPGK
jgi:peptide/nickel transport system substrate-binding protein